MNETNVSTTKNDDMDLENKLDRVLFQYDHYCIGNGAK